MVKEMAIIFQRIQAFGFIIALLFISQPSGVSGASSTLEERVQALLSNRHPQDSSEAWLALGPEAPSLLKKLYLKTDSTYHQIRVLEGLSYFGAQEGVRGFIEESIKTTQEPAVRIAGVQVLPRSHGLSGKPILARFLQDPDPQLRVSAGEALISLQDPEARRWVEDAAKSEKLEWLSDRLRRAATPLPIRQLSVASSSEIKLDPSWTGRWKGQALISTQNAKGQWSVKSSPVGLEMRSEAGRPLEARIFWTMVGPSVISAGSTKGGVSPKRVHESLEGWVIRSPNTMAGAWHWTPELTFALDLELEAQQETGRIIGVLNLEGRKLPSGYMVLTKVPGKPGPVKFNGSNLHGIKH
jgi:hypothetical protein